VLFAVAELFVIGPIGLVVGTSLIHAYTYFYMCCVLESQLFLSFTFIRSVLYIDLSDVIRRYQCYNEVHKFVVSYVVNKYWNVFFRLRYTLNVIYLHIWHYLVAFVACYVVNEYHWNTFSCDFRVVDLILSIIQIIVEDHVPPPPSPPGDRCPYPEVLAMVLTVWAT